MQNNSRTQINNWLRANGIQGQKQIRRASWRHCELYLHDPLYHPGAQEIYDSIGQTPCALSDQDIFHHTHLVNAVILILLRPEDLPNLVNQEVFPLPKTIAVVAEEENECSIYKNMLFNYLWKVIQNYEQTTPEAKSTNRRLQEMEDRIQQLESYTGVNHNGENRIQS